MGDAMRVKEAAGDMSRLDGAPKKAASAFARTKSIREQRECLLAYSVCASPLHAIRKNNIVKTTQLTQYLAEEGSPSTGSWGAPSRGGWRQ